MIDVWLTRPSTEGNVNIRIDGAMVELLTRVDPSRYEKNVIMKKGKKLFYVSL